MLCGSHFDLGSGEYGLRRHRIFETGGWRVDSSPGPCRHVGLALPVYGHAGGTSRRDGLRFPGVDAWREGMGIEWMTGAELKEAIPPAFTEWIGRTWIEAGVSGPRPPEPSMPQPSGVRSLPGGSDSRPSIAVGVTAGA
jgi:hypothetical protein